MGHGGSLHRKMVERGKAVPYRKRAERDKPVPYIGKWRNGASLFPTKEEGGTGQAHSLPEDSGTGQGGSLPEDGGTGQARSLQRKAAEWGKYDPLSDENLSSFSAWT